MKSKSPRKHYKIRLSSAKKTENLIKNRKLIQLKSFDAKGSKLKKDKKIFKLFRLKTKSGSKTILPKLKKKQSIFDIVQKINISKLDFKDKKPTRLPPTLKPLNSLKFKNRIKSKLINKENRSKLQKSKSSFIQNI